MMDNKLGEHCDYISSRGEHGCLCQIFQFVARCLTYQHCHPLSSHALSVASKIEYLYALILLNSANYSQVMITFLLLYLLFYSLSFCYSLAL